MIKPVGMMIKPKVFSRVRSIKYSSSFHSFVEQCYFSVLFCFVIKILSPFVDKEKHRVEKSRSPNERNKTQPNLFKQRMRNKTKLF